MFAKRLLAHSDGKLLSRRFRRCRSLLLLALIFWTASHEVTQRVHTGRPRLRLLVSYVYFESELQHHCEIQNKRTNLALFLKNAVVPSQENIRFVFTVPGNSPPVNALLRITEFPLSSKEGKIIKNAMENKLPNVLLSLQETAHPSADLCHHQKTIRAEIRKADFDFVLTLNDGARGPFTRTIEQDGGRRQNVPFSGVPLWIEPYLLRMTKFDDIALMGPFMSCEIDTHVQSWALMFDFRSLNIVLLHMQASCAPKMKWEDAVIISEVEMSTAVLNSKLSLASVVPNFERFSYHYREALQNGVTEVRDKLRGCVNPTTRDAGRAAFLGDALLYEAVFIKYGGEIWRERLLSPEIEELILSSSAKYLNLEDSLHCIRDRT